MPQVDEESQQFLKSFNTKLSPEDEKAFRVWLKAESKRRGRNVAMDLYTYDVRGFWEDRESIDSRGHGTDRYKKPNHPTFSDQSIYHNAVDSKGRTFVGGRWEGQAFRPSKEMLQSTHSLAWLRRYMEKYEEGVELLLPELQDEGGKDIHGKALESYLKSRKR